MGVAYSGSEAGKSADAVRGTRSQANVSSPRLPPCRQTSEQDQPDPGVHSARTVPLVRLEAELESGTRAASGQAVGVTSNGLAPERAAVDALVVVHGGVGGPNEQILARGKAEGVDRKAVWQHVELKRRRAQGMRYEGHVQRRSEPMTADFCRSRWLRVTGAPLPCANCCRRPTTASAASSEMAVTGGLISLSSLLRSSVFCEDAPPEHTLPLPAPQLAKGTSLSGAQHSSAKDPQTWLPLAVSHEGCAATSERVEEPPALPTDMTTRDVP